MPFDKSLLTRQLPVIVIRASNQSVSGLVKRLKPHVIRFKNIRPVIVDDSENSKRLIRLQPSEALDTVLEDASMKELLAAADAEIKTDELTIGYDNMPTDEALRALLPESVSVVPSSFETAGHIAHMNLLAEHLPHRHLIGEVILDKNPPIRTVVYKTGNIETEFRTFPMEIIAGVDDTIVEQRQCGARFHFDYQTVYWNTRLQMEHERIIKGMPKGSIICTNDCSARCCMVVAKTAVCVLGAQVTCSPGSGRSRYRWPRPGTGCTRTTKTQSPTDGCAPTRP